MSCFHHAPLPVVLFSSEGGGGMQHKMEVPCNNAAPSFAS